MASSLIKDRHFDGVASERVSPVATLEDGVERPEDVGLMFDSKLLPVFTALVDYYRSDITVQEVASTHGWDSRQERTWTDARARANRVVESLMDIHGHTRRAGRAQPRNTQRS